MRIGIEAQRIFRSKKHGMDIFALQLIRNLQEIDQENEYFIFVKPGPDHACLQATANFHIVEVKGCTYLDWEQLSLPMAIRKYDLDLLHCTSNTAPLVVSVPTVMTIHDVIYLTDKGAEKGTWYQRLGHYYRKFVVPQAARKAMKIVTVSSYEKEIMKQHFEEAKIDFVYNGIANHFFDASFSISEELPKEYLLFLGNMAHKKNMRNVLKAYAKYLERTSDALPLVIVETNEKELGQLLATLGLSHIRHWIFLTGYVPQDQLPMLYQQATVFLYPSLRESFGIPILESMASGTPVITSSYASMPEVAGDAALTVESKDPNSIAGALHYLLNDKSLQRSLKNKGLKRAKKFRWQHAAKSYLDCYEQTVGIKVQDAFA